MRRPNWFLYLMAVLAWAMTIAAVVVVLTGCREHGDENPGPSPAPAPLAGSSR